MLKILEKIKHFFFLKMIVNEDFGCASPTFISNTLWQILKIVFFSDFEVKPLLIGFTKWLKQADVVLLFHL